MVDRFKHPPHRLDSAVAVRLSRTHLPRAAWATVLAGGLSVALAWWVARGDETSPATTASLTLPAAPMAGVPLPAPRPTAQAALAATLRASRSAPSPELLRDAPQAQTAYDASAAPGDFVTPPSVSVEH